MSYATLEQLRSYLRIEDSADSDEMQRALDTATSEINHICSQEFELAPEAVPTFRYVQPRWRTDLRQWVADLPRLETYTDFAVFLWNENDSDWTTELDTSTIIPAPGLRPYGAGPWNQFVFPSGTFTGSYSDPEGVEATVMLQGLFGWSAIPEAVVTACLIQAARIHKRRDALFGIVGAPDGSDATRLQDRMDPDAVKALRGYIRYWAAR